MAVYYNEIDKNAAQWLRNLIADGKIPEGCVDERPIQEVQPEDLDGYTQCHFFSGIGGWPLALDIAGWPRDRQVWTGSCPCQPYSAAGEGRGDDDCRNLWPDFYRLIRECRPDVVFGEQVTAAIRHGWLDGVSSDLEKEGYSCGAIVLGAHSVGAPHIRQRLFWVGNSAVCRWKRGDWTGKQEQRPWEGCGGFCRENCRGIECSDGRIRCVGRGVFPLVNGIPRDLGQRFPELRRLVRSARSNRVSRLRGYGNAIVPQVAAEFVRAFLESE